MSHNKKIGPKHPYHVIGASQPFYKAFYFYILSGKRGIGDNGPSSTGAGGATGSKRKIHFPPSYRFHYRYERTTGGKKVRQYP